MAAPRVAAKQVLESRHTREVTALTFSDDGKSLASGSNDGSIRIWDVARHVVVRIVRRVGQFSPVAWDGGERIVFKSNGPAPILFDLTREQATASFDEVGGPSSVQRGPGNKAWAASLFRRVVVLDEERKKTRDFELSSATKLGWDGNKMVFSADGSTVLAAHAADAIVVRSIANNAPERVHKIPNAQAVRIFAISPDGSHALVSGFTQTVSGSPWLVPTAAGSTPVALPWPTTGRPDSLSPIVHDVTIGRTLAAAGTFGGVYVWDLASKKPVWAKPIPPEPGTPIVNGESVDKVALSPDGSLLATGTASGRVFLYDAATGRLQAELGAKATWSEDIVFASPTVVASLATDARTHLSRISTWSLADARLTATDAVPQVEAFTADAAGKLVSMRTVDKPDCAATFVRVVDGVRGASTPMCVAGATSFDPWIGKTRLDAASGLALVPLGINPRGILDVKTGALTKLEGTEPPAEVLQQAILAPGAAHVVGNDTKTIFVWSAKTGKITHRIAVPNTPTALAFSRDGRHLAAAVSPFLSGNTFILTYDVATGAKVGEAALSGGVISSIAFGETHNVIAVAGISASRGSFLVLRDGKVAANSVDDADYPSRLVVDPTSSVAATMSQDGGLRIWDMKTASLRATLAVFDDGEWIAATPSGRYTGTNEVGARVGWVYTAPLERFGFEQFSSFYRDADGVQKRLAGREATAASTTAAEAPARPPTIAITEAPSRAKPLDGVVAKIKVRASSTSRVDAVRVFAEGRPVAEKALCASEGVVEFDVPLVRGLNHVSVVAFDDAGFSSNEASVDLPATRADLPNPDIWVVAVGVGSYPGLPSRGDPSGLDFQLPGASNDARSIAAVFSAMKGGAYANVHVVTLTDHDATPAAIRTAMASLAAMKPSDVGVVFLAGHGLKGAKDGDMVFVTDGARWDKQGVTPESLAAAGVGWADIGGALSRAKGRVLVMLDACHSGDVTRAVVVPNEGLAEELVRGQRAGAVVFAAAKGRQFSYEVGSSTDGDTKRGLVLEVGKIPLVHTGGGDAHGLFTGALLAALANPETDRNADGAIQLSEIIDQVSFAVTSATRGKQAPWVAHRELFGDFRIANAAK